MVFLLVFLLFSIDESPVLWQGRFRPMESVQHEVSNKGDLLAVPDELNEGNWQKLSTLDVPQDKVAQTLYELYAPLAGKAYLTTHTKTFYYPTFWQLKLERWYTKIPWVNVLIALYIVALFFRPALFAAVLLHTSLLIARCLILERPPVSSMAETVLYVPWIAAVFGLFSHQKIFRVAACITVIILLSLLQWSGFGPHLETVPAVLDSKFWLTIHVLMVVGSYAFFLVAGVLAHIALLMKKPLSQAIRRSLYIGIALLIPGTILGGVWAAESWGRFWDWDPKESWAFISSAIFLVVVHLDRFKKIGLFGLSIGTIIGFQAITFTWYGVNYILGTGLHTYGFGHGGEIYYYAFILCELFFLIAMCAKKQLTKKTDPC